MHGHLHPVVVDALEFAAGLDLVDEGVDRGVDFFLALAGAGAVVEVLEFELVLELAGTRLLDALDVEKMLPPSAWTWPETSAWIEGASPS